MYFIVQKKSCFLNEIVKLCFKIKVQNCNYKHKKQILKNNQKRKNKQNEKVGNQKLGKVGNLKKIILSFFISEFLILAVRQNRKLRFKNLRKNIRDFQGF